MIDKELTQIRVVSLCGLHVRELRDIGICANLRVVDLSNNFLAKIEPLINCPHLLKLDLHGNQVWHRIQLCFGLCFLMFILLLYSCSCSDRYM